MIKIKSKYIIQMAMRLIAIALFTWTISAQSQENQKILFVGNSFTFYWNLPSVVESMVKERGISLNIYQSTAGSATLKDHWNSERSLLTRSLIDNESFSIVILQDYSSNPLLKQKESHEYFNRFIKLLHSKESEVIIYGTWMFPAINQKKYEGSDPIQYSLKSIADKTNSRIAPVGTAFRLFQKAHPSIPIFTSDNKHPSAVGTYLAACVFFKMITGESPIGLERRFERKDEFGKKVFLGMIEKGAALKCQTIVDKINIE